MFRTYINFFCFSFILGTFPLLWLKSLYFYNFICLIAVLSVFVILVTIKIVKIKSTTIIIFFIFIFSFFLAGFIATEKSDHYLQNIKPYIDKTISIEGRIISLDFSGNFALLKTPPFTAIQVYKINNHYLKKSFRMNVLWNNKPVTSIGESWRFKVATRVIHSNLNEGGFDLQRFYLSKQELLTGSIKSATFLDRSFSLRQIIAAPLIKFLSLSEYPDLILALGLGDRTLLTKKHSILLFETGVIHLLAISGMHILLVFFLSSSLIAFLQKKLKIKMILYWMPIVGGLCITLFYGWLTGLSPPTQRALLALTFWILLKFFNFSCSNWLKLFYIIFLLILFDPLIILSESFWLSCYAVFCLIFISHFLNFSFNHSSKILRYLVHLCFLQILLTILLLPIQVIIFSGFSLTSIPANLIAIPIISLFVFPLILILLITYQLSCLYFFSLFILCCIDQALHFLFRILHYLSNYWITIPDDIFILAFMGWIFILLYRFNRLYQYLPLLLIMLLICLLPQFKKSKYSWRLDQIDIGHGLAIVISKDKKAIVYDTGASTENGTKAERTLIPFLEYHNLKLDKIIISHQDNDHIGGLDELKKKYPDHQLVSSSASLTNQIDCIAGTIFYWQDLKISVLWPLKLAALAQNPDSCVIQIDDGKHKVLLTGDLEAKQELYLARQSQSMLAANILQVPHHGSKTSSTYALLSQVKPDIALISTSRYNQWKLPAISRLERYDELNIPHLNSARSGQISIYFYPKKYEVIEYRSKIKPRWYHDWFG